MKCGQTFRSVALLLGVTMTASMGLAGGAGGQTQHENPLATLAQGSLEIWAPKTFFTGRMDDPTARIMHQYQWPSLLNEFKSDFPGFDLRFNVLDRDDFVQSVHGTGPHPPPDIVFVDSQNERGPLRDSGAVIEMLGLSRFNANGWWLIFRQSKNFAAAQAFLLWLAQSPHWQPKPVNTAPMEPSDSIAVQAIAREAAQGYLRVDAPSLSLVMDQQASRFYRLVAGEVLGNIEPLLTFGDSKLAFVLMGAVCQREKTFGMLHLALVLRKAEGSWKVLLFLEGALPHLEGVLRSFDRLMVQDGPPETVPVVKLMEPADQARIARYPRGELAWQTADSPVSTYLVESQFSQPGSSNWTLSRVQFVPPPQSEPLVKVEIPFGVGQQPHRWRIWAIGRTGDVSISEWRTIDFTN